MSMPILPFIGLAFQIVCCVAMILATRSVRKRSNEIFTRLKLSLFCLQAVRARCRMALEKYTDSSDLAEELGSMSHTAIEVATRPFGESARLVVACRHADLKRVGDSQYKSECPICGGVLPVRRDEKTARILPDDNCLQCGQHFHYTDFEK